MAHVKKIFSPDVKWITKKMGGMTFKIMFDERYDSYATVTNEGRYQRENNLTNEF